MLTFKAPRSIDSGLISGRQWIDKWRPRDPNSTELALILEDDISISNYAYRWIKTVHKSNPDFAGSTLTSDKQKPHDGSFEVLSRPENETVFMYKSVCEVSYTKDIAL